MYCVGLILEPGWDAGGKRLETVMVSKVTEGGVADQCGVWEGDEVMRVNGRAVKDAGWVGTMSSLDGKKICLSLSCCEIPILLFFSSQCLPHTEDMSYWDASVWGDQSDCWEPDMPRPSLLPHWAIIGDDPTAYSTHTHQRSEKYHSMIIMMMGANSYAH